MAGKPWFAWEWLYDLAVGWLESMLGLNGVVWLTAVVIAAVFAWLFRLLVARGTNFLVAVVLVLLAVSASMIHFLARPHVVSWLFTLAWFWILDSSERECFEDEEGRRWLWALPLADAGVGECARRLSGGICAVGDFLLGAVWSWFRAKEDRIEESLQKIAAAKPGAESGVGRVAFCGSEPGESLWMEAALAHLFLSVEPLPDGSY